MKYFIHLGIAFNFCINFTALVMNVWFCSPRPGAGWDLKSEWHCYHMIPNLIVLGAFNIVLDLYLLILPLPMVLKLQIRLRKKLGVMIIFMTGIL